MKAAAFTKGMTDIMQAKIKMTNIDNKRPRPKVFEEANKIKEATMITHNKPLINFCKEMEGCVSAKDAKKGCIKKETIE